MYKLSDDQVDYMLQDIRSRGIEMEELQLDLLDHVCCIIERELEEGQDFVRFYEQSITRFFKNELREIEEETHKLLMFKDYYAMKKVMNIFGILTATLIFLGSLFKAMHWPGASIMLVSGGVSFALFFLPLLIILKFSDEGRIADKIVTSLGAVLGIMATFGSLFKIMHWPYANMLAITSTGAFLILFIPLYFFTRYRRPELKFNTMVATVLMLGGGGMLFSLMNLKSTTSMDKQVGTMSQITYEGIRKTQAENDLLLHNFNLSAHPEFAQFNETSEELYTSIDGIKRYLIAVANHVPAEQVDDLGVENLKNPYDGMVVHEYFMEGGNEHSVKSLVQAITDYNQKLTQVAPAAENLQIEVQAPDFDGKMVSFLIHDLTQIQWQIVANQGRLNAKLLAQQSNG